MVCSTTTVIIAKDTGMILKAQLNAYFSILPESVASLTEDGCVTLTTGLMTQFASLGYGSMRGAIFAKTMGTPLAKIILPPNDIQNNYSAPVKFKK